MFSSVIMPFRPGLIGCSVFLFRQIIQTVNSMLVERSKLKKVAKHTANMEHILVDRTTVTYHTYPIRMVHY